MYLFFHFFSHFKEQELKMCEPLLNKNAFKPLALAPRQALRITADGKKACKISKKLAEDFAKVYVEKMRAKGLDPLNYLLNVVFDDILHSVKVLMDDEQSDASSGEDAPQPQRRQTREQPQPQPQAQPQVPSLAQVQALFTALASAQAVTQAPAVTQATASASPPAPAPKKSRGRPRREVVEAFEANQDEDEEAIEEDV